jgi:hypothetical protein
MLLISEHENIFVGNYWIGFIIVVERIIPEEYDNIGQ